MRSPPCMVKSSSITDKGLRSAGKPISPPVKTRVIKLPQSPKDQRSQMIEGLCHKVCCRFALRAEEDLCFLTTKLPAV